MKLEGIITPLITPLLGRDRLDVEGLERLVEHMVAGGIHGLFALGSTGEGPNLSYRLRAELVQRLCEIVKGRVPILVSVTDTAFEESLKMSQVAAEAGADAVVLATPYYFPAGQTELIQYVENIVAELALPTVLYNMPSLTKVWFEVETLKSLAGQERILGVKDSSDDLEYYSEVCSLRSLRSDWSFLIGPEDKLIRSISLGGNGGVNGGANLFPRLFVDAYNAAVSKDQLRSSLLQRKIEALGQIYAIGHYASRFIKGTKCAASLLGLCNDFMAEPFNRFYPEDRTKVAAILEKLNPNSNETTSTHA